MEIYKWGRKCWPFNLILTLGLVVLCGVSMIFRFLNTDKIYSSIESNSVLKNPHQCNWKSNDPVLFNLQTKMGVNYDAGHWFHMAENFMTYHSILRAQKRLSNSSIIYFNFDDGKMNLTE